MDDVKWERAAGAGGILFVVLTFVGGFAAGSPPKTSDSAGKIAKYFADNESAIRWGSLLTIVATIFIVWWAASVFRMMQRASGNPRLGVVAVAGVAIASVCGIVTAVIYSTVAILGANGAGGPNGEKFFYVLGTNMNAGTALGAAIFVGSISAVILRTGVLPKAIGALGALAALLNVASTGLAASNRDVFFALSIAGFLVSMLFILIVAVMTLRGPQAPAEAAVA
ncbi:MAG: DUF4386 family protein [Acidimicrobiia bacterium]|jgi:hypothetical protein